MLVWGEDIKEDEGHQGEEEKISSFSKATQEEGEEISSFSSSPIIKNNIQYNKIKSKQLNRRSTLQSNRFI